ncbi:MAG: MaoC family dehydratase [Deltaproteobacteria bacterium]|jgi:3-hydroxybutyryl-CoA dehydratase|nr:MaoC family dehydratase [Deltaproteobacteria bacterium]
MPRLKDMRIGDSAEKEVLVSDELVSAFAELTDDTNPIHTDEGYAAKSFFGRRVAHGMLPAAFFGTLLGTMLPGPGTIYLYQGLEFKAPVFIGDSITVKVEITEIVERLGKITLRTTAKKNGEILIDGKAAILFRPIEN